ncbi:hypothetical protein G4B88_022257 [Cannabis sativa]|uniref:Uncharacterized protein n=1 Tax=Cannabis sativa TaxID=3483 RepID=A0A7J6DL85_CANSA|nr:hypothetical protein G4B88_022257 [Cannabis sativa]
MTKTEAKTTTAMDPTTVKEAETAPSQKENRMENQRSMMEWELSLELLRLLPEQGRRISEIEPEQEKSSSVFVGKVKVLGTEQRWRPLALRPLLLPKQSLHEPFLERED